MDFFESHYELIVLICNDGGSLYDICGNRIDIGLLRTIYRLDYTHLYRWQILAGLPEEFELLLGYLLQGYSRIIPSSIKL